MKLTSHRYGKARVRLLKLRRDGSHHEVVEVEVDIALEGDFEPSFNRADNRLVVPTDTMKNTLQVLAQEHLTQEIERFGVTVGNHFLHRYPQVRSVSVHLTQRNWRRLVLDGEAHPHSFEQSPAQAVAHVHCERGAVRLESGIEHCLIMKTTGSGFEGFPRDEFTTLPETRDRILATEMQAQWTWSSAPPSYTRSNQEVMQALLRTFARNYSPSVQATLYEMAQAALTAVPEMESIRLVLPNKHYLPVNLTPFGLENPNELFLPTDEPHGQIEATVARG